MAVLPAEPTPETLDSLTVVVLGSDAPITAQGNDVLRTWVEEGGRVVSVEALPAAVAETPMGRGTWTRVHPRIAEELEAGMPQAWSLLARLAGGRR
jgi:hypothetical protein